LAAQTAKADAVAAKDTAVLAKNDVVNGLSAQAIEIASLGARTDAAEAAITTTNAVAVSASGVANAISGTQTQVNGRKAGFEIANDGSVANFRVIGANFLVGTEAAGVFTPAFKMVAGQTTINDALIRQLKVAKNPADTVFFPVALAPLKIAGADGESKNYGGVLTNIPLVQWDGLGAPAVAAGETIDIRPNAITNSGFDIVAKKFIAGATEAQNSGAGIDVGAGNVPRWRANKPTIADANQNLYVFNFHAQIPLIGSEYFGEGMWENESIEWRRHRSL
ncbi:MAG: hypothetical protein FD128_2854, partial [Hyphomonadaceae bacterium]